MKNVRGTQGWLETPHAAKSLHRQKFGNLNPKRVDIHIQFYIHVHLIFFSIYFNNVSVRTKTF